MAARQVVFLLCVIKLSFQEGIYNILGDSVEFSGTKRCQERGAKLTHEPKGVPARPVAHWDDGWKPEPGYRDRMSPNESVILDRTNIKDNGLYQLTCNNTLIHLYVVVPYKVSVTEGQNQTLDFHHMSEGGGTVGYMRCDRNRKLVFEVDLSSGKITYGTGFEDRVSVSSHWKAQGDFSPTLQRVRLEDQGDYFFYALLKDRNRTGQSPVVVRMTVKKTNPDQITTCAPPPVCPTQRPAEEKMGPGTIVAIIEAGILLVIVAAGFVWCLKFRKPNVSSGPGAGRSAQTEETLLTETGTGGSHVNGGPSRVHFNTGRARIVII